MNTTRKSRPFPLLIYFGVASLITILAVGAAVTFSYRQVAVGSIVELGEDINLTVAQIALHSIKQDLLAFLEAVADAEPDEVRNNQMPAALASGVRDLLRETAVVRIKIYNRLGVVVHSTRPEQIGRIQAENEGFRTAMGGNVASKLIYRDRFNVFDRETSEDNLIQSYVPVRDGDLAPVVGVFEVYVDVNRLVRLSERAQTLIIPVVFGFFLLLFVVLIGIVWRAEVQVNRQAEIISDRNRTLETLSAQLLSAQEDEKRRIAGILHEDISQSLGAAKMRVESAGSAMAQGGPDAELLSGLAGLLQELIRTTRGLAMQLRPLSLDQFGLVEALSGFFSEFRDLHPELHIVTELALEEDEIPRPLKIVAYRIVQDTLNSLVSQTEADHLEVRLERRGDAIDLAICENATSFLAHATEDERVGHSYESMRERTLLSGGEFLVRRGERDLTCVIASWIA